jgi:tRNA-binding protein
MSDLISFPDFEKVDLRCGTIVEAKAFPEARVPAIQLWIDFGPELGVKKTSAQITDYYDPAGLVGTQVVAVVNFPPKQIGPFRSEVLVLGALEPGKRVVLLRPDREVENGLRIM